MRQNTFSAKDKLIFKTDDFELNIQFVDLNSEEGTEKSLINILNNCFLDYEYSLAIWIFTFIKIFVYIIYIFSIDF